MTDRERLEMKAAAKLELDRRKSRYIPGDVESSAKACAYWISRFCWTFDPKREPYHFRFRLFPFQEDLVRTMVNAIMSGEDIMVDKTREMGATYTITCVFLWFWIHSPGSNFLVGSRKEAFVDATKAMKGEELSNKEESLFGKMEYVLGRMEPVALPKGFDLSRHKTSMSLVNPENGNVISGESSNENFSRGGRQKAILLDEFAFWDNDVGAWGATADTTDCRIVLTTPGTRPSKAKKLRFGDDGETIKVVTLPYWLDPRKDQAWLDRQRARRSSEDFAREIMIDWMGSLTGVVYPEMAKHRLGTYPYDPRWPLWCSWDFGLDGTSMIWIQENPNSGRTRIVDYYENADRTIDFYFPMAGRPMVMRNADLYAVDDMRAIRELKPLSKAIHFGDPDVAKRSLISGSRTREELSRVGIEVTTNPGANDFPTRREQSKIVLQQGIDVNDNPRTRRWISCMENARYPERSDNSQAVTAVRLPIHNWTSHGRTAFEYWCVNRRIGSGGDGKVLKKKDPLDEVRLAHLPFPDDALRLFR